MEKYKCERCGKNDVKIAFHFGGKELFVCRHCANELSGEYKKILGVEFLSTSTPNSTIEKEQP